MPDHLRDPRTLTDDEIEAIERLTLRSLFQAIIDLGMDVHQIFHDSTDDQKDVAEDITREALDKLRGYTISQRIYGTVDFRAARYVILPEFMVRQAFLVDSKAEKSSRTGTIQMSQTSLRVRQTRGGNDVDEQGLLPMFSTYGSLDYLNTTMLTHYYYDGKSGANELKEVTVVAIPNGRLQAIYNPTAHDSFWLAGRNSDQRGEDFRVRVSFERLKSRRLWRVQRIKYNPVANRIDYQWEE